MKKLSIKPSMSIKDLPKIISPLRFRMLAAYLEQTKAGIVGVNGGNLSKDLRDFAKLFEELIKK